MILNTGSRTDIPAFYSEWFCRRVAAGEVLVRSPYAADQVLRYRIDPAVVDLITFCTKNPRPMLPRLPELSVFRQLWYVTITPYGKDIEPNVPPWEEVCASVRELSRQVGPRAVIWRYDPILLTGRYTADFHEEAFERMAAALEGSTQRVVISFLDLYEKTKKNFPEGREVPRDIRLKLGEAIAASAARHGMKVHTCLEGEELAPFGIDTTGCMTKQVVEEVLGEELAVPKSLPAAREGCRCLLGADIGAYNTCRHFCRYCYANADREAVAVNAARHDPASPMLVGNVLPGDTIRDARQEKWCTGQLVLW